MLRVFNLLLVCVVFMLIAGCGPESDAVKTAPDFRNINWGMSVDEVKAAEGLPVLEEGPRTTVKDQYYLRYGDVEYLGRKAVLRYFFHDDECWEASYLFYDADTKQYESILEDCIILYGNFQRSRDDGDGSVTYLWNGEKQFTYLRYYSSEQLGDSIAVTSTSYEYLPPEAVGL